MALVEDDLLEAARAMTMLAKDAQGEELQEARRESAGFGRQEQDTDLDHARNLAGGLLDFFENARADRGRPDCLLVRYEDLIRDREGTTKALNDFLGLKLDPDPERATRDYLHAHRGEISGIIDWGDTAIGDPAIDFTGLLASYGKDFVERVLSRYRGRVDASFRDRCNFMLGGNPTYCDQGLANPFKNVAPFDGTTYYTDGDGDGYGDSDAPVTACEAGGGR